MCDEGAPEAALATVAEALHLARLAVDFLNSPAAADAPGSGRGGARAALLRSGSCLIRQVKNILKEVRLHGPRRRGGCQ
jgi:hypothetical protein